MTSDGYFMYFAFGSNLLKERLQLKNPSATFHSTGRLKVGYFTNVKPFESALKALSYIHDIYCC